MANREMNFDLSKQPRLTPIIYGRVGDGSVQKVTVYLTLNDEPIDLTGYIITFEGMTNGNATVVMDTEGVVNRDDKNGKFDYIFPNMAFGVPGDYERAYFSITETESRQRSTTSNFQISVLEVADITAKKAETIITEYNKLIDKLNDAYKKALNDYDELSKQHIDELAKKIDAEALRVDTLNGRLDTIQSTISDFEKRMEALENNGAAMKDEVMLIKGQISSEDWNTIKESGFYQVNKATGANRPMADYSSGTLEVFNQTSLIIQRFTHSSGQIYTRSFYGNQWTAWKIQSPDLTNYPTRDEVTAEILPVKNELQTHKNDKNNPHGVTATQVGAIPTTSAIKQTVTTPINFTNNIYHNDKLLLDETDNVIYRYRRSSLDNSWWEQKAKDAVNDTESKVELWRKGNLVIANWRVNVKDNTKFETSMPQIYRFPVGYRPFIDMGGTIYNAPLNIYQYSFNQTSLIQYAGIIELSGNDIRFASNKNGNHYVQGSFITRDPFPAAGSLEGGTVIITPRNADGSMDQQS